MAVVGAVVVRRDAILLVQRANPPNAGTWSVPGGKIEFEETARAAVAREVREETGLDVDVGAFAGWFEGIREGMHFVALDFFATPRASDPVPVAGDDAAGARWVPLEEVPAYELADGLLEFLRDIGSLT